MIEGDMAADVIKAVTGNSDLEQVSVNTTAANQVELTEKGKRAIGGKERRTKNSQHCLKVGQ